MLQNAWNPDQRIRQSKLSAPTQSAVLTIPPSGPLRPQSHRPARPNTSSRSIHNRHPRLGDKLLRPPPNRREIPAPAPSPLDLRLRVCRRRHRSTLRSAQFAQAQVCRRGPRIRSLPRRLRDQSLRAGGDPLPDSPKLVVLRSRRPLRHGADELRRPGYQSRRKSR